MERKAILVEALGAPMRIVQHIRATSRATAICPFCRKRFKRGDPTVIVDAVKRIPLTGEDKDRSEFSVRIHLCEPCAEPLIRQKQEAFESLVSFLAKLAVDKMIRARKKGMALGSRKQG